MSVRSVSADTAEQPLDAIMHAVVPPDFDVQAVRRDFPILSERVHDHPLVWLDNAATRVAPWPRP